MLFRKINTKEKLPQKEGYYTIFTDRAYGYTHFSNQTKKWTLENGEIWEATYPNYWLAEIDYYSLVPNGFTSKINNLGLFSEGGFLYDQIFETLVKKFNVVCSIEDSKDGFEGKIMNIEECWGIRTESSKDYNTAKENLLKEALNLIEK